MDYYEIGQRIRRVRKARGMSQEELAERIGISVTHMSHIETANTKLSLPVFVAMAEALSVSADALLYDAPRQNVTQSASEIDEMLSACTPGQAKVLAEIVKAAKQAMDAHL